MKSSNVALLVLSVVMCFYTQSLSANQCESDLLESEDDTSPSEPWTEALLLEEESDETIAVNTTDGSVTLTANEQVLLNVSNTENCSAYGFVSEIATNFTIGFYDGNDTTCTSIMNVTLEYVTQYYPARSVLELLAEYANVLWLVE
eukprot:980144_1